MLTFGPHRRTLLPIRQTLAAFYALLYEGCLDTSLRLTNSVPYINRAHQVLDCLLALPDVQNATSQAIRFNDDYYHHSVGTFSCMLRRSNF